ncbi:hypothetical protein DL768_006230 [Monosporascus sp. mg162]|nr:hypothetical protein DL768_006230 [Monosporascus sp. mg162]
MMLRGPPGLDDDLDPWPAMENRASMLAYRMIEEFDDFFLQPEWKEAIAQARVRALGGDIRGQFSSAYELDTYYERWPSWTMEMQAISVDQTREGMRE